MKKVREVGDVFSVDSFGVGWGFDISCVVYVIEGVVMVYVSAKSRLWDAR